MTWGTRHGHEGVAEYFSLLDENLELEQFEPREFVAQGDTVVVVGFERSVSVGRAGAYNVSILPFCPYSPYCLEGEFSEVRGDGVLGTSQSARSRKFCTAPVLFNRMRLWGVCVL